MYLCQGSCSDVKWVPCTLRIRRIEHRKWNRGRNRLSKLVQTTAPSILFSVFNPPYPPVTHQVEPNLALTSKQKFRFGLAKTVLMSIRGLTQSDVSPCICVLKSSVETESN